MERGLCSKVPQDTIGYSMDGEGSASRKELTGDMYI